MAGRFANLEFDERHGHDIQPQVVGETGPDARYYLDRAFEARCWNEHEQALRTYTRCLQEDRTAIVAWVGQVQMLVELREYAEARTWSDKALEVFRNNGELSAAKAQACARMGDFEGAQAASDNSMKAPGCSPWRWSSRAEVLLARSQRHHEECFTRALSEPDTELYDRVTICRIYRYYKRPTNALVFLQPVLEAHPELGYLWLERGYCELDLGMSAAATRCFERSLEVRQDSRAAAQALAAIGRRTLWGRICAGTRRWRRR